MLPTYIVEVPDCDSQVNKRNAQKNPEGLSTFSLNLNFHLHWLHFNCKLETPSSLNSCLFLCYPLKYRMFFFFFLSLFSKLLCSLQTHLISFDFYSIQPPVLVFLNRAQGKLGCQLVPCMKLNILFPAGTK